MSDEILPDGDQASSSSLHLAIRKIAHDISNPLGVLRMAAYFLRSVPDDKERRERYLEMMDLNIDRIEQSLKQLRALTETGSADHDPAGGEDDRI